MREAMAQALVGDDVFADDPSVNAVQEKIADMLGFEAALFMATGTQSNLCAILAHCQRGDEYIVGQMQHCYRWEGGGAAVFGSVQPQPLAHQADGSLALADIEAAVKPDDPHFARSRLLKAAQEVANVLTEAYPKAGLWFADRSHAYAGELGRIHDGALKTFSEIPGQRRFLFTSHDSMAYFGAAYRLQVRSIATAAGAAGAAVPAKGNFADHNSAPVSASNARNFSSSVPATKTNPPAVTLAPPKFCEPVFGTPCFVSSSNSPSGTRHNALPVLRS